MRKLRVADNIGAIVGAESKRGSPRVAVIDVRKQRNSERPPALKSHYAEGLPASENRGQPSTIRNKRPAFATRKVVAVAQREAMPHVEIRAASLACSVEAV